MIDREPDPIELHRLEDDGGPPPCVRAQAEAEAELLRRCEAIRDGATLLAPVRGGGKSEIVRRLAFANGGTITFGGATVPIKSLSVDYGPSTPKIFLADRGFCTMTTLPTAPKPETGRRAVDVFRAALGLLVRRLGLGRIAPYEPSTGTGERRRGAIRRANPRIDVIRPAGHVPHPDRERHCVA